MRDDSLKRFIDSETMAYIEPHRQGTARGDKIGFSKKKFQAALMCMSTLKLKTISEIIGVNYGVLRKWRTEREFKQVVESCLKRYNSVCPQTSKWKWTTTIQGIEVITTNHYSVTEIQELIKMWGGSVDEWNKARGSEMRIRKCN
jgi:hypothetical protein